MPDGSETLMVGCYTGDRGRGAGISVVRAGVVGPTVPAVSPSFLAWHPNLPVVYAVAEAAAGAVAAWEIDIGGADGDPNAAARPLGVGDTGGADPCHLTVDTSGEFLVTVNYTGGSVAVHPLDAGGRILERTDLVRHERHGRMPRQEVAHPHMVHAAGAALIIADLGGDAVYRYHLDAGHLVLDRLIETPTGSGPRHLVRVGDRFMVAAELSNSVLVYTADWTLLGDVPATRSPADCWVSELVASGDGRFLYVANRGPDTVTVFALDGDLPEYVSEVPTGGGPRHLARDGDLLFVANELSDEVTTMRIDPATGVPVRVGGFATPSPTCVLVR